MKTIFRATLAALVIGALSVPAQADEIEETLQMALEAYQAGDINAAKEEIDYAAQLIAQLKAAGLSDFLPEALPDWTRAEGEQGGAAMMGGFGGGMTASATYTRDNDMIEIQIMAENQMVASMAMMFGNPAMMGSMGQIKRIKRQKVVITQQGDLQAMIDSRIFVQISGRSPIEDKEAYFAALDISGLKDF
jgi:hypothetical protein